MSEEQEGLRFECTQCGKCCTLREDYGHVYLNRDEQKALADSKKRELEKKKEIEKARAKQKLEDKLKKLLE